ncbi:XPG domain containing-domain-containing protein [Annulohypoxylon truncatum]|uniref:XPG domain containing-domain-containing protein n=1 Tax=Annulohypoxylon truncatum TaxID=327061 RepID=UPI002007ADAE|nr:XPG domain containing-domain-containing protein [Annulohypoxylon truncatum]KAI1209059.1 XPG domain containing-domain-containing protein [Annulohypoxylon truncatum]
MGIRGFVSSVSRFGVLSHLSGHTVVIDGPALAHRISETCMVNRPVSGGFACLPPYELLSRMVIGWLDALKSHNVNVRRIYFDGYLPPSKWHVRKNRLLRQSQNIRKLVSSNPCGSTKTPGNAFDHLEIGLGMTNQNNKLHDDIPRPPFLVPAVLEALRKDEYWGPLVIVVPGEADMFCAEDIRKNGGTVLTTDSDFLIQDLGLKGDVAFLWGIRSDDQNPNSIPLKAYKMSLHDINHQLGVETKGGLPRIAFEKQRGGKNGKDLPFDLVLDNVRKNRKAALDCPHYKKFMDELKLKKYLPSHHPVLSLLPDLDPRISEVIIQALLLKKATEPSTSEEKELRGPETLSIFLPILFENNHILSAWTQGTNVRELAYSLLQTVVLQKVEWIVEYRTLGSLSAHAGRRIRIPDLEEVVANCARLVALLEKLTESFSSVGMQWLAFSVYRDIQYSTSEGRKILSAALIKESTSLPKSPERYSWDLIHFTAQVQAQLYSLRIVKQILEVVLALGQELPASVQQLHSRLASLPLIAEWPTVESMSSLLSEFDKLDGLAITTGILGTPENKLKISRDIREETKKEKSRESKRYKKQVEFTKPLLNNPYYILEQLG